MQQNGIFGITIFPTELLLDLNPFLTRIFCFIFLFFLKSNVHFVQATK